MKKDEQLPIDDQQYYDIVSTKTIIKLTVKELTLIIIFILSIGISLGGFIKILSDVKDLSTKMDKMSEEVTTIKVQNAQIEEYLNIMNNKGIKK